MTTLSTYAAAYDALPTPVSAIDLDGTLLYTNAPFCDLFRLADDNTASIFSLTPPQYHRAISAAMAELAAGTSDNVELEGTCITLDGTEFWGRLHASAIREADGAITGFLGVVLDHTEAEQRHRELLEGHERALAVAEAKSGFVASVSHELRSPLHTILGLSELLCSADLRPEEERLASAIHSEGEALRGVIDDILEFSRAEAGRLTLVPTTFSPAVLVDETVETLRRSAEEKGLTLTADVRPDCPPAVTADRNRIRQILVNLVTNAVKYTEAGSITVVVDYTNANLELSVADTGVGIPHNRLSDLFEPFAQVRGEHQQRGTGLGLAITDRLVDLMDGTVDVSSTVGVGSTFLVTLPIDPLHRPSDLQRIERDRLRPEGLTVLIVEDVPINQMLTTGQLERLGYRSIVASSGQAALDQLGRDLPDLVLMDWHMPGMDGLETTRRFRATEPDGQRLPIIAMTASAMQGDREECLAAGMDDFLPKPVLIEDLNEMLAKWLMQGDAAETISQNLPTVEGDTLKRLRDEFGDPTVLTRVLETYVAELEDRATAIPDAESDLQSLHREAHTLKSTSAMLGAKKLASVCQQIELTATEEHGDMDRSPLFAQLATAIADTRDEMKDALEWI